MRAERRVYKYSGTQQNPSISAHFEAPSDLGGIVYIHLDEAGAWKLKLAKEWTRAVAGRQRPKSWRKVRPGDRSQ